MTLPLISPENAISKLGCLASRNDLLRLSMVASRLDPCESSGKNKVWCNCALDLAVEQLSEKTSINARSTINRCVALARRKRIVEG